MHRSRKYRAGSDFAGWAAPYYNPATSSVTLNPGPVISNVLRPPKTAMPKKTKLCAVGLMLLGTLALSDLVANVILEQRTQGLIAAFFLPVGIGLGVGYPMCRALASLIYGLLAAIFGVCTLAGVATAFGGNIERGFILLLALTLGASLFFTWAWSHLLSVETKRWFTVSSAPRNLALQIRLSTFFSYSLSWAYS